MIHYLWYWNPVELNYNGIVVVTLSLPLTIQFKVKLVIAAAIAVDRLQAIRWPLYFRYKNQSYFICGAIVLGLLLAAVDVYLEYRLDPIPWNVRVVASW